MAYLNLADLHYKWDMISSMSPAKKCNDVKKRLEHTGKGTLIILQIQVYNQNIKVWYILHLQIWW